jgi:NADPH2:quinone reductase
MSADPGPTADPGQTMTAAWYDRQGPADEVLRVGQLPVPVPSGGEVRVAVSLSGISPGDTKKRAGTRGSLMPYPRVIPHSDAAGIIDAVGPGVDDARVGERVWVFGAQSYRPFGTAAQWTVVPGAQAIALPDQVSDETGAALGIPGITAHRAVFGDGPVTGKVVLVQGVLGAVGSLAAQLATVIGTVRHAGDLAAVDRMSVPHAVPLDQPDPAAAIRMAAPAGVDRIVEVALSENGELDASVVANDAVIATYSSLSDRIDLPFLPLLFANVTIRLLGSDDFPHQAKQDAARDLTAAATAGALSVRVGAVFPLTDIAHAHARVDAGGGGRVLVRVPG